MHTICLNLLGSIRCPSKWPLNHTVGADLSLRMNDGPILIAEKSLCSTLVISGSSMRSDYAHIDLSRGKHCGKLTVVFFGGFRLPNFRDHIRQLREIPARFIPLMSPPILIGALTQNRLSLFKSMNNCTVAVNLQRRRRKHTHSLFFHGGSAHNYFHTLKPGGSAESKESFFIRCPPV